MVVDGLRAGYGTLRRAVPALQDVSLSAAAGVVTALVGPNGAGKTTLLRVLLGFLEPWEGSVLIEGLPPRLHRRRHGVGYLPESAHLPAGWTVASFLQRGASMSGLAAGAREQEVREVLSRTALADRARARLDRLSKGLARRAALAFALTGSPGLVLLDEPMSGLDPPSRIALRNVVSGARARGAAVIFSSHELGEVERIADRVIFLKEGTVQADIPWDPASGDRLEERLAW